MQDGVECHNLGVEGRRYGSRVEGRGLRVEDFEGRGLETPIIT